MNIFAIAECEESPIKRISVNASLQREIAELLSAQKAQFLDGQEKVTYTGSYKVDIGEIFCIKEYPLDQQIIDALINPVAVDILNLREEGISIRALFAGVWNNNSKYVCFQTMDSRRMLSKKLTLLNSGNTFTRLNDPGIVLQDKLTALYENQELLFSSYHNTRRILELSEYYKEATDADLETFCATGCIQVDNPELFKVNADSIIRKKVALLQQNNVLENLDLNNLSELASEYEVTVTIENDKIIMPDNRKDLKELVRFLDEDYYTGPITGRKCLTNSKQYL